MSVISSFVSLQAVVRAINDWEETRKPFRDAASDLLGRIGYTGFGVCAGGSEGGGKLFHGKKVRGQWWFGLNGAMVYT